MMDSEEEEEQTALVCDNGKFWVGNILMILTLYCRDYVVTIG